MPRTRTITGFFLALPIACLIGSNANGQAPAAPSSKAHDEHAKGKVDPEINAQFRKADPKEWIRRFETEDREVFARRGEIIEALNLRPGMAVADVGAGTGLFTRLMAEKVETSGKVFAVDVSKAFLKHIAEQSQKLGQTQVKTVEGNQKSTNLPPQSVDLVFLCDVYHHLENPEPVLASIHQALKPGGALVLIEFDRVKGKSSEFVLKHVRAGKSQFFHEIEGAGFRLDTNQPKAKLSENFFARFLKKANAAPGEPRN